MALYGNRKYFYFGRIVVLRWSESRLAYQARQAFQRWLVKKISSSRTGLTAKALVNFCEHIDGGQRIAAGFEEVFIKTEVVSFQNPRPDFVELVKDVINVVGKPPDGDLARGRRIGALRFQILREEPTLRFPEFPAWDLVHELNAMRYFEWRQTLRSELP